MIAPARESARASRAPWAAKAAFVLLATALLVGLSSAWALLPVPPLRARVTDLAQTLRPQERAALEARLAALEAKTGAQIAVLLVPTTQPESIEQYARRVLDEWKLGRKGVDDGALLLVAKDDRTVRIETQYGLEGVIPDAIAKRIIEEEVVPRFRAGDFYGGLERAVTRMSALVEGEPLPPVERQPSSSEASDLLAPLLVFVLAGGVVLRLVFGQFLGAAIGAGVVAVVVWLVASSLLLALLAALLAFLLLLAGGHGGYGGLSTRGGWGGGFGGGGGLGGGGGASGRW